MYLPKNFPAVGRACRLSSSNKKKIKRRRLSSFKCKKEKKSTHGNLQESRHSVL